MSRKKQTIESETHPITEGALIFLSVSGYILKLLTAVACALNRAPSLNVAVSGRNTTLSVG